jgi:hypothetical protein
MDSLDNPIWSALCTKHKSLAQSDTNDLVRIYPRDMLPMAGLKNLDPDSFKALSSMLEDGRRLGICVVKEPDIPKDFKIVMQFDTAQMVRYKAPEFFESKCTDSGKLIF